MFVVYGPQGCGKTTNAEVLRQKFGLVRVIDGWNGLDKLKPGDLALTNCEPPYAFDYPTIPYELAMKY